MTFVINQVQAIPNDVSTGNSSSTPLAGGATFTGTGEEVTNYGSISIFCFADQASAVDGLSLEYSTNNTNWDDTDVYTTTAGAAKHIVVPPEAQYFRVRFTNGATPQTAFRLQTIYRKVQGKSSSHNLRESLSEENDAELVKAVLAGKKPDGTFTNAAFDTQGRLIVAEVSTNAAGAGFATGLVTTSSTTEVPIRATSYNEQAANATRSISSSSASDAAAGVGARQVLINYYTATFTGPFTTTVTLNGTTPVNLSVSDVCYVDSMDVVSVGSTGNNVGILTLFVATAGGGGTIGTIAAAANQTYWAHHYVPTGRTCLITAISGSNDHKTDNTVIALKGKTLGGTAPDIVVSDFVRAGGTANQITRSYGSPLRVVGPARLLLYGKPETSAAINSNGSFDFYEQPT